MELINKTKTGYSILGVEILKKKIFLCDFVMLSILEGLIKDSCMRFIDLYQVTQKKHLT
jgi:hypothetical protein